MWMWVGVWHRILVNTGILAKPPKYIQFLNGHDLMGFRLYADIETTWYKNSMEPITEYVVNRNFPLVYCKNLYQREYGVIIGIDPNNGWSEYVEFPSESDAILFMLRWA